VGVELVQNRHLPQGQHQHSLPLLRLLLLQHLALAVPAAPQPGRVLLVALHCHPLPLLQLLLMCPLLLCRLAQQGPRQNALSLKAAAAA
jgi:hypothetical protein